METKFLKVKADQIRVYKDFSLDDVIVNKETNWSSG